MSNYTNHGGAAAEVLADFSTGKIITRFYDPGTQEMLVEIHLDPEVAREYAFNLTSASVAIDND